MWALILSDIHANLEALLAVLDHVDDRGGFDVIWCLGDTVGYGPDPAACISLLHHHPFVGVSGNHDQAAIGRMSTQGFTPVAEAAALWTRGQVFKLGDQRCIINPGGVGQPRDHDPRTNYAVFDSSRDTIEQHRVTYDIEKTQAKMRAAKLPQGLIQRLTYGV